MIVTGESVFGLSLIIYAIGIHDKREINVN